jgi:hypothetical protein
MTKLKPGDRVRVVGVRGTAKIRAILASMHGALLEKQIDGFRRWNLDELRLVKRASRTTQMKLIATILIGLLCVACNSKSATQKPQDPWPLWIDDSLARHESETARTIEASARAFENAFNLDKVTMD